MDFQIEDFAAGADNSSIQGQSTRSAPVVNSAGSVLDVHGPLCTSLVQARSGVWMTINMGMEAFLRRRARRPGICGGAL